MFPLSVDAEAEAQFERFLALVQAAMPANAGILVKYRPMFVAKFAKKIGAGWVPKKGWATEVGGGAEPELEVDLTPAELRRILAHGWEVFRRSRQAA